MSIPRRFEMQKEQECMIQKYADKFMSRFGYDIVEEWGEDLMEWSENDFEALWEEHLQNEENEGMGL